MSEKSNILRMPELSEILGMSDNRTILRWLDSKGITYEKLGREYKINRWIFEYKMELETVVELKKTFPTNWADIFNAKCNNKELKEAVFIEHPRINEKVINQINKSKLKTYIL